MTSVAKIPVLETDAVHRRDFALWARDYDDAPNPLLSLEQRFLSPLLPDRSSDDVLDVGCGMAGALFRLWKSATAQSDRNRFFSGDARPRPTQAWTESHARCGQRNLVAHRESFS